VAHFAAAGWSSSWLLYPRLLLVFSCLHVLQPVLALVLVLAQHPRVGILPVAAGGPRHVRRGARDFLERQVRLAAARRHAANADPGLRGAAVLPFLDQRFPRFAVAELRRLLNPGRLARQAH